MLSRCRQLPRCAVSLTIGCQPEIARLRGIRFALASETEKGQRWSANKIKTLTGGDTVASRGLYQDMIEFKSKATIWVACNHKPEVDVRCRYVALHPPHTFYQSVSPR